MAHASDHNGILLQNLKDAGCDDKTIQSCMILFQKNDMAEVKRLLSRHKRKLLEAVHIYQKEIDCLDYLMFQMEHGKHEGGTIL